jgi:hypothetical protein
MLLWLSKHSGSKGVVSLSFVAASNETGQDRLRADWEPASAGSRARLSWRGLLDKSISVLLKSAK